MKLLLMAYRTLSCPTCRRWLVYVPLDGLTLHYRCEEHGSLILRPLGVVDADGGYDSGERLRHSAA